MTADATRIYGQVPFVEVGDPTAVDLDQDVIVVGGGHGYPQWNGFSPWNRSGRDADFFGWFVLGIYAPDLSCTRLLSSVWPVNSIAIHPSGELVAIGTGEYDGGYAFEGELLIVDLATGVATSVLSASRSVRRVEWLQDGALQLTLAPETDEEIPESEWPKYECHVVVLRREDWREVGAREVVITTEPFTTVPRPPPSEREQARLVLDQLVLGTNQQRQLRGRAWALTVDESGGITAGSRSRLERWGASNGTAPVWQVELEGVCTQLMPVGPGRAIASFWGGSGDHFDDLTTDVFSVGTAEGTVAVIKHASPALLISRSDGSLLVRDTHRLGIGRASVFSGDGRELGDLRLGAYDLFNHFFDIRGADEFLILAGDENKTYQNKWIAEVRQTSPGVWEENRLFPLDWESDRSLSAGPGVLLSDKTGRDLVHAGTFHHPHGLLPGNAFVVSRRYEDGGLNWLVELDNQVTAVDAMDGKVVAVTNLGELTVIDADTGSVLRRDILTAAGHRLVPLSLALARPDVAYVGILDGRVIQIEI